MSALDEGCRPRCSADADGAVSGVAAQGRAMAGVDGASSCGGLPEVCVVEATGSTNDDARELARCGALQGTAVAARSQSGGRGRRGHAWASPEGGLYLSVVLRPGVGPQHFVGLPAVCALGALRAVREASGLGSRVGIKWPNDLVIDNRKLAGLLVEAGAGEGGPFAVLGIGINLVRPDGSSPAAQPTACFDSPRPLAPVYLSDELPAGEPPAFETLATLVRDRVVEACDAWAVDVRAGRAKAGPLAPILSEYFDCVPMLGHPAVALSSEGAEICRGSFVAIDVWGRVTIHTATGHDVVLAAEQASLRPLE